MLCTLLKSAQLSFSVVRGLPWRKRTTTTKSTARRRGSVGARQTHGVFAGYMRLCVYTLIPRHDNNLIMFIYYKSFWLCCDHQPLCLPPPVVRCLREKKRRKTSSPISAQTRRGSDSSEISCGFAEAWVTMNSILEMSFNDEERESSLEKVSPSRSRSLVAPDCRW